MKKFPKKITLNKPPMGIITEGLPESWKGLELAPIKPEKAQGEKIWESQERISAGYIVSKEEIIQKMEERGNFDAASILIELQYSYIKIPFKYCD